MTGVEMFQVLEVATGEQLLTLTRLSSGNSTCTFGKKAETARCQPPSSSIGMNDECYPSFGEPKEAVNCRFP